MSESLTSHRVLARKYRPQKLSDLVGQELLAKTIAQGIERNRLPHAFLFHGIRGVGKTTTARILAKALNCTGIDGQGAPTPDPCGVCPSCVAIQEDRHLDVIEMDAASRTGVDDVREVIEAVRYKAVQSRVKIYIIDEVHMLSKSAFNALLKTLEEPPNGVKFVFATTELRKIPETILSRCMRFDLVRIAPAALLGHLKNILTQEKLSGDEAALSMIVRAADGSARDALSLLDQAIALSDTPHIQTQTVQTMLGLVDRGSLFSLITSLFRGDVAASLEQVRTKIAQGADPQMILSELLDIVYWITCLRTVPQLQNDPSWPESDREQGLALANALSMAALMRAWQVLHRGVQELAQSPLQTPCLEMILLRLMHLESLPKASDLLAAVQNLPPPVWSPPMAPTSSHKTAPESIPSSTPLTGTQTLQSVVSDLAQTPHQEAKLPETFQDLIQFIREIREPILASSLLHDVHLIHYEPGCLSFRLAKSGNKSLPDDLKRTLGQHFTHPWVIDVQEAGGSPTLMEVRSQETANREENIRKHPLVSGVAQTFEGASIKIEQIGE